MPRFLTPSKVALLALISIYTEGVVPSSAVVPLLAFLVSHLLPLEASRTVGHGHVHGHGLPADTGSSSGIVGSNSSSSSSGGSRSNKETAAADERTQRRTATVPLQGTPSVEEVEEATSCLASSVPGRSIWDLFLKRLWQFDCADTLDEFFSSLADILVRSREERLLDPDRAKEEDEEQKKHGRVMLARHSPLGAFVRRVRLEYTKLQFHDAMALWKAFIRYRMPTYAGWAKRNPIEAPQGTVDANLCELGLGLDSPLARVMYGDLLADADEAGEGDEGAGMSVRDVERLLEFQISKMQGKATRVPPGMMAQLRRVIMAGATVPCLFHYLRFLDSWKAGDHPSSLDHLHRYFDYTVQTRDRTFYQYALLNLALLQADFGCLGEAISAFQETIAIGRETHDMNCLNYSMTWLYHFGKISPDELAEIHNTGMLGADKEALAFLQTKAKEAEMWGMLSTALLSEGRLELANGGSIASTYESIIKASHVCITRGRQDSMGPQMMLHASLYNRLGLNHLTCSTYETFLECYSSFSPMDDNLWATFRWAQQLSKNGRNEEAMNLMNNLPADDLQPLKHQQTWAFNKGLLKLTRQLNRNDVRASDHLLKQLEAASPPDPETLNALNLLKIEFMTRQGDYEEALEIVREVAASMHQNNFDVATQISLLIAKARIFDKTGSPERGFTMAMRAAKMAYSSRMLQSLWDAIGAVCVVLMSFHEFSAALLILEAVMPQVLECEDRALAGRMYSHLADGYVGLAGESRDDPVRNKEFLACAVECIDYAFAEYSAIEDSLGQCEMMGKKSTIMYQQRDLTLANDFAAKYLVLKCQAASEYL
ncbi:anaphase-promoting complex protein [Nannizzia gypsea CBS 118893]|uniref:Anaphase-promoting complex subunit 5 n=1 Tax=Arthroderma gypseum (strain ATCC MYA-4604 / CBS 118893) TaxID=535722 RepID=E4UWD9_ARTGP|nr:anaphase-promoting complex protein [Nannizzia gypsea CBS 118893]EFR02534.1 anaphase-promoting complex protein [Nannizzia gypsea CBS 118893]